MIPKEDEEELSSSSSISRPNGKSASFAQAHSISLGPELDEDSARLIEDYRTNPLAPWKMTVNQILIKRLIAIYHGIVTILAMVLCVKCSCNVQAAAILL